MTDLNKNLLLLIQSSIDLANQVRKDIELGHTISLETVEALNKFVTNHDNLDTVLDVINDIN